MRRLSITPILALPLILLGLGGCADAPNSVGSLLLPPGDRPVLKQDTLYAVGHSTRREIINTGGGNHVLIGDTANFSAWTLLRFTALPDSLYFAEITDARIVLTCRYRFGSPAAPLSFTVHRALQGWLGDSLTVDSLLLNGTSYYDPTPLATVNAGIIADTGTVDIPIADTALVRSWFNAYPDSLTQTYGIVIRPTNSSVVRGFTSFLYPDVDVRPKLVINYTLSTSSGSYTAQFGLSRFVATVPDADILKDTASYAYVVNGVGFRGQLTFDVSRLPRSTIVNRAYLEVSLAASQSLRTGFVPDSLFAGFVTQSGGLTLSLVRASLAFQDSLQRRFYQFEVRDFVQNWLAAPTLPRRIAVIGYNEAEALDLFAVNGSGAPLALRPRLRIVYSSSQH